MIRPIKIKVFVSPPYFFFSTEVGNCFCHKSFFCILKEKMGAGGYPTIHVLSG